MRTLVTGSSGFIAGHLPQFEEMLEVDLKTGDDVRTSETMDLIADFDPHVVFHLAAHHFIPWCEANPIETERTNVLGTVNVLEACGKSLQSFVLASSAAIYGYDPDPISEDHAFLGKSVYGHSKFHAEVALRDAAHPNARFVAARLFNAVGVGDMADHVLPAIMKNRREGVMLGNTWPKRDFVHVADVADALVFLSENAPLGFSAYNVGTGIGTSIQQLIDLVGAMDDDPVRTTTYAGKVRADDGHLVADPSKLARLGWQPSLSLEDAVMDLLAAEVSSV